jgi:hypothetical protein
MKRLVNFWHGTWLGQPLRAGGLGLLLLLAAAPGLFGPDPANGGEPGPAPPDRPRAPSAGPAGDGAPRGDNTPGAEGAAGPYAAWKNGPGRGADVFPLAVWLQDPKNAGRYKDLGINLYVGLWRGPTEGQVAELKKHGMPVVCALNDFARDHLDEPTFVGWMQGDEPDNAQSLGRGKGYGPPVSPDATAAAYARIKAADPTRPVLLNLGQGVAWDGWRGRGARTNHPEDYAEYLRGCDIASFDIYPAVHADRAVAGKLWYVARGVDRLRRWAGSKKVVWDCVECARIDNPDVKPTPDQVKAEVWMSIVHGSRGLIYFCHQFRPRFVEASLLAEDDMARAVAEVNRQVQDLAAVINSPPVEGDVRVETTPADVSPELKKAFETGPVAVSVRRHGGAAYVFAVRMEASPARATFRVRGLADGTRVEVLGQKRSLPSRGGAFEDDFAPHAVHLYRIGP